LTDKELITDYLSGHRVAGQLGRELRCEMEPHGQSLWLSVKPGKIARLGDLGKQKSTQEMQAESL